MKKEIIKKYINNLTNDEINLFLEENNITLNKDEYDFLIPLLKEKFDDLLSENPYLFKLIKDEINTDSYNKLINLFNKYKTFIN